MGLILAISSLSSSLVFSTKLFLLEILPSLYLQVLTPLPLFFLLNLLIISILAISRLCKEAAPGGLAPQSPKSPKSSDHHYADYRPKFTEIMGNELYGAANHWIVNEYVAADHRQEKPAAKYLAAASELSVHLNSVGSNDRPLDCANCEEDDGKSATNYFITDQPIDVGSKLLRDLQDDRKDHGRRSTAGDYSDRLQANNKVPGSARQIKNADRFQYQDHTCTSLEGDYEGITEKPNIISGSSDSGRVAETSDRESGKAAEWKTANRERAFISPGSQEQERPLASTRFTSKKASSRMHLDVLRSNSPLKISRPTARRGDTLDATWKAICEDKLRHSSPLAHHHKANHARKGDHHLKVHNNDSPNVSGELHLSPSSSSKQSTRSMSALMRRREPSISRDELNARVESFISKFHEQIRIQREESLLNYRSTVSRGAH